MTPADVTIPAQLVLCRRCRRAEAEAARWRQIAERYADDNDRLRTDLLRHEGHAIRAGGYRMPVPGAERAVDGTNGAGEGEGTREGL